MTEHPRIKILVGYHRPSVLLKNDIYVPIHLGRAVAMEKSKDGVLSEQDNRWMLGNMIGDDTGDNISSRNRTFCELTGIYWAWKNFEVLGNPDYIGFMHYRRILDFKGRSSDYPINRFLGLPSVNYFSEIPDILDSEFTSIYIKEKQYIINEHHKVNAIKHFISSKWCREEDLQLALSIIKANYPEFLPFATDYLNHDQTYFCNTFILPKDAFFQYAEFIFSVAFSMEHSIDLSDEKYKKERQRALAMTAEQLTGIFFTYLKSKYDITEVPLFYIEHPEEKFVQEESSIPIIFATDKNYFLYLGVAIESIIENKNAETKYDIIILETDLTNFQIEKLKSLAKKGVHIRVLNVTEICKKYEINKLMAINHLTQTAYVRLLLCEILENYHKVIYLDCDLVVLTDLSEVYHNADLSHKYAGVVRDHLIADVLITHTTFKRYMRDVLNVRDLNLYFNSGVMIFNLDLMRDNNIQSKFLEVALINNKYFHDQNVLNAVLYKKVIYLDGRYNVNWHLIFDRVQTEFSNRKWKAYLDELDDPKILHYTSAFKPWKTPDLPSSKFFWRYARLLPFYEEIMYTNIGTLCISANREVSDANQKFLAANQELSNSNQKLLAANQELSDANQKLLAVNRELSAANQKLLTANHDSSAANRELLKNALNYRKLSLRLCRYRVLSKLTFGDARKRYTKKKRLLREKVRQIRKFLK